MMRAPQFETTPFSEEVASRISRDFEQGRADDVPARSLTRAGVVNVHHLRGGIFWRREPVKYIIVHSTETGVPQSAPRVIESWSSMGRRHPGAQYVVDRDGTIYQAVDPDLATVHVNIFKTLPGINNDNSIGIEMCHAGRQNYPNDQVQSVIRLVAYLQDRYKVADDNIITHRYAQQGDHTDPVNFDWAGFLADKDRFRTRAIAAKVNKIRDDAQSWTSIAIPKTPPASTYLQPHQALPDGNGSPVTAAPLQVEIKRRPSTIITPKNSLELRGPIETDPVTIKQLNQPLQPAQIVPAPSPESVFVPAPAQTSTVTPAPAPAVVIPAPSAAPVPAPEARPDATLMPAKESSKFVAPSPAPRLSPAPAVSPLKPAPDVQFFVH